MKYDVYNYHMILVVCLVMLTHKKLRNIIGIHFVMPAKVKIGSDQEMAQSKRNVYSKNRGGLNLHSENIS